MKPDVVLITPGTLSKSASVHQKQPPAKVATSCFGAVCANGRAERRPGTQNDGKQDEQCAFHAPILSPPDLTRYS